MTDALEPQKVDRRTMLTAGALLAGAGAANAQTAAADKPPGLSLAFRAFITLGPVLEQGTTDRLRNRFIPITRGKVARPKLQGVVPGPPAVMQRLAAGERVDPSLYYMRTAPRFVVPTGPHRWLMETVFVGVGKRWPDSVEIEYWAVA